MKRLWEYTSEDLGLTGRLAEAHTKWRAARMEGDMLAAPAQGEPMTAERDALAALGVIGNGYCFCSYDRDPNKSTHEPECREARAVLAAPAPDLSMPNAWPGLAAAPAQGEPMTAPPREPTQDMIAAGLLVYSVTGGDLWADTEAVWRAMYDAAPAPTVAQPAEPVVLQVTPGSSPPADCVDDGVQWFCPHCNPCRGGPLCRKPAERPAEWSCKRCGCHAFLRSAKLGMPARQCAKCNTVDDSDQQPAEPPATDDLPCIAGCGRPSMMPISEYCLLCSAREQPMTIALAQRADGLERWGNADTDEVGRESGWHQRADGYWTPWHLAAALVERQAREIAAAKDELERERVRLAACGVVAGQNTRSSAQDRIAGDSWAWSASYGDVCRAVDAEMDARERAERAEAERDALREDAERYRWLRDANNWSEEGPMPCVATFDSTIYGTALDAAIDAARAGK